MEHPQQYSPPFSKDDQLNSDLDAITIAPESWATVRLPGQPRIRLNDFELLWQYLEREYCSEDLEKLAPHLWMMSTQSSANISPLHRQRVKGRRIIITEDPRLHLVWVDDRIFIKPLPAYLLSHVFWSIFMCSHDHDGTVSASLLLKHDGRKRQARIARAALGYLRTYYHLVRYESDFLIAQEEHLVPSYIDFASFCAFTAALPSIPDAAVSGRYAYGELRLSRLNFYAKLFLRKYYFQRLHPQYGAYLAQFYAPVLFLFGVLSVILGAMQVETATEALFPSHVVWEGFWYVCRWFSMMALGLVLMVCIALTCLFLYRFLDEWSHAISTRLRKKRAMRNSMV